MIAILTKICRPALASSALTSSLPFFTGINFSFARNQKANSNSKALTTNIKQQKTKTQSPPRVIGDMVKMFTELDGKRQQKTTRGRSWRAEQLRLKSTQDLHKLWYVCVRQKNLLLADSIIIKKMNGQIRMNKSRLSLIKLSMARILTVIQERAQIRKQYRQKLELQYIQKKRLQLEQRVKSQPQPLPQITWQILRSKYQDLRRGIDNVDYLEKMWSSRQKWASRQKRGEERVQKLSQQQSFKSFWQKQKEYGERPTQQQILKSHVKNWKQLNLKQRKIILGFLNARRAKQAKTDFAKQLRILGQKIAYQQQKQRISAQSANN